MGATWIGAKRRGYAQNATPQEWRFAFPCWSLASQQIMAGGFTPRLSQTPPAGIPFFLGRIWRMLLPGVCFFVGSPESSSSRYITGNLPGAIAVPFIS
jgi:hypothetical protein